jgi:hypothetical protein
MDRPIQDIFDQKSSDKLIKTDNTILIGKYQWILGLLFFFCIPLINNNKKHKILENQ